MEELLFFFTYHFIPFFVPRWGIPDLHVTVDGGLSVREGHEIARQVKRAICTSNTHVAEVLVHIEPSDLLNE